MKQRTTQVSFLSFSSSSLAVTSYCLYRLFPEIEIVDAQADAASFSIAALLPKRIGSESIEFIQEMFRTIVREKLSFRSFSMVPSVARGYIESERMICDTRLIHAIEQSEPQDIIDIVQIGLHFCTLAGDAQFASNTEELKWTEIAKVEIQESEDQNKEKNTLFPYVIRGCVASSPKEARRLKNELQRFFDIESLKEKLIRKRQLALISVQPQYHSDDNLFSYFSQFSAVLLPQAVASLDADITAWGAKRLRIPCLPEGEENGGSSIPISIVQYIYRQWKRAISGIGTIGSEGWYGDIHTVTLSCSPASQSIIPALSHSTVLSLFISSIPMSEYREVVRKAIQFITERKCADVHIPLHLHIVASSRIKDRKSSAYEEKIGEIEGVVKRGIPSSFLESAEVHVVKSSHVKREEHIIFFSFPMVGQEKILYHAALLFENIPATTSKRGDGQGADGYYRVLFMPTLAFEKLQAFGMLQASLEKNRSPL